ncbi:MAG: hypothetical protein LBN97_09800 [Oscillospiraceae bacterium]|jgi:CarD family transcriptional regulator|nr:hypothetical protein [Oscillospiraceae bacterium]
MYSVGEMVFYENTGICQISDITDKKTEETGENQLYYVLKPLYVDYTISVPVGSGNVFMRPIISKNEAERLIDSIPAIKVKPKKYTAVGELDKYYKSYFTSHKCEDLLELTVSINAKKVQSEKKKRWLGVIDEKYKRKAEDMLFGELAAALEIERSEVPDYIANRVDSEQSGAK